MCTEELIKIQKTIDSLSGTLSESEREARERYGECWRAYFYGLYGEAIRIAVRELQLVVNYQDYYNRIAREEFELELIKKQQ